MKLIVKKEWFRRRTSICCIGISEILGIDLEKEILYEINKNIHREYKVINGVNTRLKEYEE